MGSEATIAPTGAVAEGHKAGGVAVASLTRAGLLLKQGQVYYY